MINWSCRRIQVRISKPAPPILAGGDIKSVHITLKTFSHSEDETLYCELVQWSEECSSGKCTILAQYLGSLNEVLFPPNMCWSDGVDLLMRRCKDFPVSYMKKTLSKIFKSKDTKNQSTYSFKL